MDLVPEFVLLYWTINIRGFSLFIYWIIYIIVHIIDIIVYIIIHMIDSFLYFLKYQLTINIRILISKNLAYIIQIQINILITLFIYFYFFITIIKIQLNFLIKLLLIIFLLFNKLYNIIFINIFIKLNFLKQPFQYFIQLWLMNYFILFNHFTNNVSWLL